MLGIKPPFPTSHPPPPQFRGPFPGLGLHLPDLLQPPLERPVSAEIEGFLAVFLGVQELAGGKPWPGLIGTLSLKSLEGQRSWGSVHE